MSSRIPQPFDTLPDSDAQKVADPDAQKVADSDAQKVAEYWARQPSYGRNWYSFPITSEYIINSITGQSDTPLTAWLIAKHFPTLPINSVLIVCCGHGNKERSLAQAGMIRSCDAYDISEGAIDSAREAAVAAGLDDRLHYGIMDFNSPTLGEELYDLILCNGALHHIRSLERCVAALHRALKVGGWLWASEFTGPSRYAYSPHEVEIINDAKRELPPELGAAESFHPAQLAPKLGADPSEAVRSAEIESVLRAQFETLEVKPYGGNILMRALGQEFFGNFDEANPLHVDAVHRLIEREKSLLAAGERSHHAYFLARRERS